MEQTQILNVIGLSLDLIGVAIVFFWAQLQPNLEEGIGLGLEDENVVDGKTVLEHNKDKQKKKIRGLSRFGLGLILIGFSIQIISNLLQA